MLGRFISQDPIGFYGGINLYTYAAGNPISLVDPFGTDPGSESGEGPARLESNPVTGEDIPVYTVTGFGTAITEANGTLQSGSGSLEQLFSNMFNSPWVFSGIFPIVGVPVLLGIGPAGDIAWNPVTHTLCVGVGIGASGGKNLTIGPLAIGKSFNGKSYPNGADGILRGWSLSGGFNWPFLLGVQGTINGSGWALGPSLGAPGFSVASTASGCVTF